MLKMRLLFFIIQANRMLVVCPHLPQNFQSTGYDDIYFPETPKIHFQYHRSILLDKLLLNWVKTN